MLSWARLLSQPTSRRATMSPSALRLTSIMQSSMRVRPVPVQGSVRYLSSKFEGGDKRQKGRNRRGAPQEMKPKWVKNKVKAEEAAKVEKEVKAAGMQKPKAPERPRAPRRQGGNQGRRGRNDKQGQIRVAPHVAKANAEAKAKAEKLAAEALARKQAKEEAMSVPVLPTNIDDPVPLDADIGQPPVLTTESESDAQATDYQFRDEFDYGNWSTGSCSEWAVEADEEDVLTYELMRGYEDMFNPEETPVILPEIQDDMFERYTSAPQYWTIERLAQGFNVKKVHVKSILKFKQLEKEQEEAGVEMFSEEPAYILAREDRFARDKYGHVKNYDGRWKLNETSGGLPGTSFVEEEVNQYAYGVKRLPHIHKTHHNLPLEPPATMADGSPRLDGEFIHKPSEEEKAKLTGKKRQRGRAPILIFDSSASQQDGFMIVKEGDGSIRHATWEERVKVHYKPAPSKRRPPEDSPKVDQVHFAFDPEEQALRELQAKLREQRLAKEKAAST